MKQRAIIEGAAGRPPDPWTRVVAAGSLALLLVAGCSLDESEFKVESVDITAQIVPTRVVLPDGSDLQRRSLIDGIATDPEWGETPYHILAMSPQQGVGGGTFLAALKVAHDGGRLFLLLQWPDATVDRLGPRLVFAPDSAISANCDPQLEACHWVLTDDNEDRAAFMWDMGDARDSRGTFFDRGCAVACHGNMHPAAGSVDIWHWRAARTNPIQFPIFSTRVGFADDEYADSGGRVADPGLSFFSDNFERVACADGGTGPVPLMTPLALDADGQPSTVVNDNMRPCEYIAESRARVFNECVTRNPCRLFEQTDVEVWVDGDDLSATLLSRPTNNDAREDRHDIEARGRYDNGSWTLEMSRALRTGSSRDVQFDDGQVFSFSIAIMNNAGATHSGSPVIHLTLED